MLVFCEALREMGGFVALRLISMGSKDTLCAERKWGQWFSCVS